MIVPITPLCGSHKSPLGTISVMHFSALFFFNFNTEFDVKEIWGVFS